MYVGRIKLPTTLTIAPTRLLADQIEASFHVWGRRRLPSHMAALTGAVRTRYFVQFGRTAFCNSLGSIGAAKDFSLTGKRKAY